VKWPLPNVSIVFWYIRNCQTQNSETVTCATMSMSSTSSTLQDGSEKFESEHCQPPESESEHSEAEFSEIMSQSNDDQAQGKRILRIHYYCHCLSTVKVLVIVPATRFKLQTGHYFCGVSCVSMNDAAHSCTQSFYKVQSELHYIFLSMSNFIYFCTHKSETHILKCRFLCPKCA
jgi:hypothetical protein